MEKILIDKVIPNVFSDIGKIDSGIWDTQVSFMRGKSYLIEAASGKGKSSFCSFVYGYRSDYAGDIFFDNNNIKNGSSILWDAIRKKELSLLFQELNLFPELTALENVLLKNNLTHFKTPEQIDTLFEGLGIAEKKNQKTGKMSWGQQQRVAIIRCLCQPFSFLILDEPISHLDDKNAFIVAEIVKSECASQNAGIIVTSIGKHLPLNYDKLFAL